MKDTQLSQAAYFIYFLISRPFKKLAKYIKTMVKPSILLKWLIGFTAFSLFKDSFRRAALFIMDNADFTPIFTIFLSITLIVYIWKNADVECGQQWREDYNKMMKSNEMKEKLKELKE
jgi:hypothetical protein